MVEVRKWKKTRRKKAMERSEWKRKKEMDLDYWAFVDGPYLGFVWIRIVWK